MNDLRLPLGRCGGGNRRRALMRADPGAAEPRQDDRDADGREPAQAIPVALATAGRHETILRRGAAEFLSVQWPLDAHIERDPRGLPRLLRRAGPPAPPFRVADSARRRPLDAARFRRDAAADALLPRPRVAARRAYDALAKSLPHRRHR